MPFPSLPPLTSPLLSTLPTVVLSALTRDLLCCAFTAFMALVLNLTAVPTLVHMRLPMLTPPTPEAEFAVPLLLVRVTRVRCGFKAE